MNPSMEQRRERVRNGSRRRRDLAAVGGRSRERWERDAEASAIRSAEEARKRTERERSLLAELRETAEANSAWKAARADLASHLPESTFGLWLAPLECRGEAKGALYVVAPEDIFAWAERRYGRLIGDAVRAVSEYRGAFLMPIPDAEDEEGDGCL